LHTGRNDMNSVKADLAQRSNPGDITGGMVEALEGADVFLGLSAGVVPEELIAPMAPGGIVFALSNPDPEIHPDVAAKYAAVVATGRSDFPDQINNVPAFPGVFRGALDVGARRITEKMMVAAAVATAADTSG
jgi:malate dehydrogenase (oxaloacetate-decarboxylating)